ncbi:hypothetical protein DU258_20210 [Salmonella enterica subsp. enterica]|nr:hypothetical protein [Salmonella enterica subsp. enterica serovar Kambole]ECH9427171.1 hypothetical protein [Salmonella enterica subsp. enterica]EBS2656011.1 hypothetical protein [Salmonella enterica subsp. enterica serovar Kambole]EBY4018481.1 hypothetical protein [Salmonella enterica subsp. enterica serovar Kambole]ECG3340942.1 hypothetical protein [Salmonella enterica subsp. enterica serovar Kambole]
MIEPLFCEQTDILLRQNLSARAWITATCEGVTGSCGKFIGARVDSGVYRQKIHAGTWILAQ